ncbi:MAG TPA: hypothetical protein VKS19_11400 [Verrucomicrobiae bacterium]|nr:hypothetical protein [Verrucomicrobiae bacterium]
MTEYFVKHGSKLLFPHLARDQRKRRLSIILLVLGASLFSAGVLAFWMALTGFDASRMLSFRDLSLW